MCFNKITKISCLDNLCLIEKLILSHNKITKISGLNNLVNLKELINLSNLLFINLNDNNISDLSFLLNKKTNKKTVYINGNIINYDKINNINKINSLYYYFLSNETAYHNYSNVFDILSQIKNIISDLNFII